MTYAFAPYCGAPPSPLSLWGRWNLDPFLFGGLALFLAAYIVLSGRDGRARAEGDRLCFYIGFGIGTFALVSPLCPLSVSLFSARVGQHLILTTIAAPLMALGLPWLRRVLAGSPLPAAAIFAIALWFWHSPAPYTATFTNDLAYWAMHVTTVAAALGFWAAVIGASSERLAISAAATVATGLQMALLGAVITFAPNPLYAPHALTTWAWGLSPLGDQQLGGALMWAPAGLIFAFAIVAPLARLLRREPASLSLAPAK